jgi:hypothetical protein
MQQLTLIVTEKFSSDDLTWIQGSIALQTVPYRATDVADTTWEMPAHRPYVDSSFEFRSFLLRNVVGTLPFHQTDWPNPNGYAPWEMQGSMADMEAQLPLTLRPEPEAGTADGGGPFQRQRDRSRG